MQVHLATWAELDKGESLSPPLSLSLSLPLSHPLARSLARSLTLSLSLSLSLSLFRSGGVSKRGCLEKNRFGNQGNLDIAIYHVCSMSV